MGFFISAELFSRTLFKQIQVHSEAQTILQFLESL